MNHFYLHFMYESISKYRFFLPHLINPTPTHLKRLSTKNHVSVFTYSLYCLCYLRIIIYTYYKYEYTYYDFCLSIRKFYVKYLLRKKQIQIIIVINGTIFWDGRILDRMRVFKFKVSNKILNFFFYMVIKQ